MCIHMYTCLSVYIYIFIYICVYMSIYIQIHVHRFFIKCPRCSSEIVFRTDPETSDYMMESGELALACLCQCEDSGYSRVDGLYIHGIVQMMSCAYACACLYVFVCVCICIYVFVYIYIYIYICVCIHLYMCMHIHLYIYIYICICI